LKAFILLPVFLIISIGLIGAEVLPVSPFTGSDKGQTQLEASHIEKRWVNQEEELDLLSSTIKMIASLAFILAVIILTYWVVKKFLVKSTAVFGGGKLIRTLTTSYLGQKKAVSIVEVAGEILVLGISNNHISLLTKIEDRAKVEEIKDAYGQRDPRSSFEYQLKRVSSKFKRNKGKDMLSELTNSIQEKVGRLKGI